MTKQESLELLDKLQTQYTKAGKQYFNGRKRTITARNNMIKAGELLDTHIEFVVSKGWIEDNEN
jgi:hypothetical protein